MPSLDELRKNIDELDNQLVALLSERAKLALQVRTEKEKTKSDLYSPTREQQILECVQQLAANGPFPSEAMKKIFRTMLIATRSLVGEIAVSYLGPANSFCYEAAIDHFGEHVHYRPENSIDDVFTQIKEEVVHYGVVPFESRTEGFFVSTFSKFFENALQIVAEIELKERVSSRFGNGDTVSSVRFVVIGNQACSPTGMDKTALLCTVSERPGALLEILKPFAELKITLTKIESLPIETDSLECVFFIDLPGHQLEPTISKALEKLSGICKSVKVLGSYPRLEHS